VTFAALDRLGRRQHGLVTLDQVRRAGFGRHDWYRFLDDGVLVSIHPNVARLAGSPSTPEQEILAAVRWCGTGAMASVRSAAYLWGAQVKGVEPVDISVVDGRYRRRPGVKVHRPRDLRGLGPVHVNSIPCTPALRTVLDAGIELPFMQVAAIVDQLMVGRHVSVRELTRAVEEHSRQGRHGVGAVRLVLEDLDVRSRPPDSVLETAMQRLLDGYGLPAFEFQVPMTLRGRRVRLDFARRPERVNLEVDGWAAHGGRKAWEADRERDGLLTSLGWVVLRFTWFQVLYRPEFVAATIRRTLESRRSVA
jgi:very-short-patch-repair endonuclease